MRSYIFKGVVWISTLLSELKVLLVCPCVKAASQEQMKTNSFMARSRRSRQELYCEFATSL